MRMLNSSSAEEKKRGVKRSSSFRAILEIGDRFSLSTSTKRDLEHGR